MAKLRVNNIGPLREGTGTDFISFDGVTVFIGDQGSGKSTIAKIYSTMVWLEKAFVRGDIKPGEVNKYNRFEKRYLAYQKLAGYINSESLIEFKGNAFDITFDGKNFKAKRAAQEGNYRLPKAMYVPAERNFVTAVDRPELVKRLPPSLYDFLDEFERSKSSIKEINLPFVGLKFEFDAKKSKSFLVGIDYKINILESSSGFQSLIPLLLVSEYLSKVVNESPNQSRKELNRVQYEKIREQILKLVEKGNISEEVLEMTLEEISSIRIYRCFVNIVEEMEQNLFPSTQEKVLYELLRIYNTNPHNQLVLTTHSPYVINYLTLAVKAFDPSTGKSRDESVVPSSSTLDPQKLNIYELKEGVISLLKPYEGLPSDENFLNSLLADFNDKFARLL
jgi:predicted ATP-binding protein involved in virulence